MADPQFRPLELPDRKIVRDYSDRFPLQVSELTFTNLFAWRHAKAVFLAEHDGCLLILRGSPGHEPWLLPPIGSCDLAELAPRLLELDHEGKPIAGLDRVPEAMARELEGAGLEVQHDRDNSDYVYRREDLAALRGRKYSKKRNHVKKALAGYLCRYQEIDGPLIDKCRAFQDRWCETKQCGRVPGLCQEYRAVMETLGHFDELGVIGGAVLIDDAVRSFTIGEALRPDTAVVHFEKADVAIDGLAQLINQWFCQNSLGAFEFVNREQDLGIPGLRRAKESYHPDHMVEKFKVVLPGREVAVVEEDAPVPCAKSMG